MATDPRLAWRVVEDFERAIADYCGAPHAVATDSCTNALFLCFVLRNLGTSLTFPTRTYVGVPRAAMNADYAVHFEDAEWVGEYQVKHGFAGVGIWDSARWLRRGMYRPGTWTCLSFHFTKHLPIGRGGAILCDDEDDAEWFRRARYDGRDQTRPIMEQTEFQWGIHAYMPPESAARGLLLMNDLPDHNDPLPGIYPDLSKVKFT